MNLLLVRLKDKKYSEIFFKSFKNIIIILDYLWKWFMKGIDMVLYYLVTSEQNWGLIWNIDKNSILEGIDTDQHM